MQLRNPTLLALVLATLALAACQQAPSGHHATSATSAASNPGPVIAAPTTASAPASGSSAPLPADHAATKHYKIAITLPKLPADEATLAQALRTTADNAKRQFMQALPDPNADPAFADRQLEMIINFDIVANSPAFTSVRESGMQDTGGAHPIPIQATFVFDRKAGKTLTLDDLFNDADAARKALANYAHDTLLRKFTAAAPTPSEGSPEALREWKTNMLQMLNDGTKPTTVNYSLFLVRAGGSENAPSPGLTLVFPPYQVAPYVNGTQTVDVPASVFAKFLKPRFQQDFETAAPSGTG